MTTTEKPDTRTPTVLDRLTPDRTPVAVDMTKPVRPDWMRDRATFLGTAGQWAKRNAYRGRRLTFNVPAVLLLLVLYSPRGLGRIVATLSRYLYDHDSAQVRHTHATATETAEYVKAQNVRRSNLKARWMVAGTAGLLVGGPVLAWTFPRVLAALVGVALCVWIIKLIPGRSLTEVAVGVGVGGATAWFLPSALEMLPRPPAWTLWTLLVVVVLALGWHGRPTGKSLVKSTVLPANVVEPIRAPMVTAALCTLGNAKMKEPNDIRLLMDVARQGAGYQVDLELPAGVPASYVQEKRNELAAALRRELGCVWPSVGKRHPGHLSLYISDQAMSSAQQKPWPLLAADVIDLFVPQPMFTDNVGAWMGTTIAYTAWVVGAVPRMGKTFAVRQFGLVGGLDLRAKVLAFDLKGTGDLSSLAQFAHAYSVGDEPEDIAYQLERMRWVRAEMRRRAKLIRDLTLEENPDRGKVTSPLATLAPGKFGPIVVCVDECQVWFEELEDKAVREEFIGICRDLVKRGPALGIIPMFATQKPDAKSIPTAIADNASARLCFKVNGQMSNDQVLGTSSYQAGIRATQFGFQDKGVAYFRGDGADAAIVRTVHGLDATAADELAVKIRALRVAAGLLTGDAAGEVVEPEVQVDLLDDVREVLRAESFRRIGLSALRDRLALLRGALYGTWDNDTLGGALRGRGVEPVSVHCPVEKRTAKGIKVEDVDDAGLRVVPDEDDASA